MANGQPPQIVVPGAGWVDVASRAITQVGFPVVIAGVLLWFVLGKFQVNMELITARMQANTEAAARLVNASTSEFEELKKQTEQMREQTRLLGEHASALQQLNDKAGKLVELRSQELQEYLQRVQRRAPVTVPRPPGARRSTPPEEEELLPP